MIEYKNFTNECGIYCFTNKINGKCYIGQGINLKKRLRSHYSAIKKHNVPNMIFYTAVAKYGIENFDLEILEFLDPNMDLESLKKLLDEREKFYIQEKNSYVPNGYNQTLGGDAGVLGYKMTEEQKEKIKSTSKKSAEKTKKHIWVRNISESKYSFGYTYEEAAEKTGVSKGVIKEICNKTHKYPYCKGWTFAHDEITLFNNVATALRNKAIGTYSENKGLFIKNDPRQLNKRVVLEINSQGEIILRFAGIVLAAQFIGISSKSLSRKLHKNKIIKIKDKFFKFEKDDYIPKILTLEHKQKLKNSRVGAKKVGQFDLKEFFINSFDSISDAAKSVSVDTKSISKCCHGKAKTCKNYIWKFI